VQPNRCVEFDGLAGLSSYIDLGAGLIGAGNFSLSLWANLPSGTDSQAFFGMGDPFNATGTGVGAYVQSGSIIFVARTGGTRLTVVGPALPVDQWNHIVFVMDRAGDAWLHLNGGTAKGTKITSG